MSGNSTSISRSNRIRRHIRIQRLPHKRHALGQAILIERPRRDLLAEGLHTGQERGRGALRDVVHPAQHRGVVKHVHQRAVRADEERAREKGRERELFLDLDERRQILRQVRGPLGRGRWLVQRRRVERQGRTDRDQLVGVDGMVRCRGEMGLRGGNRWLA